MEYTVKVSYMEIYMEKIRDLLNRKCIVIFVESYEVVEIPRSHASTPLRCISLTLSLHYIFATPYIPSIWHTAVNDNLPIHEEKNRGVYVKGLFEVYVSSISEIHEVMRRGGNSRMVAYTSKLPTCYFEEYSKPSNTYAHHALFY